MSTELQLPRLFYVQRGMRATASRLCLCTCELVKVRQVSIKHLPGLQESFCLLFKQEVKHFNLPSLNITSVDLWTLHKFILRMNHTLHLVLPSINWRMIFSIQSNLDGHWFLSLLMSLLLHTNTTHLFAYLLSPPLPTFFTKLKLFFLVKILISLAPQFKLAFDATALDSIYIFSQ